MDSKLYYSIGEVAEIVGVNSVTLRAWQRRYGLLKPLRTEKGHRLYSQEDIDTIHAINKWLEKGVAISKVKALLKEPSLAPTEEGLDLTELQQDLQAGRATAVEARVNDLMKTYPIGVFAQKVVEPIDEMLASNPARPCIARLWQSVVLQRCASLLAKRKATKKGLCVLATHETATHKHWLYLMQIAQDGYAYHMFDRLDDYSDLKLIDVQKIVIASEVRLTREQLAAIEKLNTHVEFVGPCAAIHSQWRQDVTGEEQQNEV
uniref:MerR family transcriptional regulator n=1 Tax=Thaumasiovibrio occultus TaxID=1891184 RepID=UPI000B3546D3|nr:MerR family transcriptional regulator [Thaumasiovibrio occultus]